MQIESGAARQTRKAFVLPVSDMSQPSFEFERPPIVELVIGVQFGPLLRLTSGHLGWFWKQFLEDDWVNATDAVLLADQFETFEEPGRWRTPNKMRVTFEASPAPPRLQLENAVGDRMIQIQRTRFHYNWKRRDQSYPSFHEVLAEFIKQLARFRSFLVASGAGELCLNQWELTYVDSIPRGELWQTLGDWHRVLPGLFSGPPPIAGVCLENASAEWNFEITPKRGRLHVTVRQTRITDTNECVLLLQTTARGPVGREADEDLEAGLALGHAVAVQTFLEITSAQAHAHWGLKS